MGDETSVCDLSRLKCVDGLVSRNVRRSTENEERENEELKRPKDAGRVV